MLAMFDEAKHLERTNPQCWVRGSRRSGQDCELAPRCAHCQCHMIGRGVEAGGAIYGCAHCAKHSGVRGVRLFSNWQEQLVALAARFAFPAIYAADGSAKAGGLMSYGSSISDGLRQMGIYAGKILDGASPGDLPVMQAVKVELVLKLKTAKSLGISFPISLLGRADEVIE